ncbi:class I histocompatibility antigen, Gogo-C*0202 alpha chain-like [Danio rerio]|uniref:Class I histocompatibility antigen, Gogo-C*0202 alpha chain-like n=1 Tax=Danio rerio TaxID=7955 RepID=A0A8M3AVG2_DANRE|nr:major histocompatibility complex class I-related gene protein-like isoform X2 [Danio rerio]|eukprot:XP_001920787.3 major histocompatibility complex class I-related gene protein-like isoform X2 [Danio rerio]
MKTMLFLLYLLSCLTFTDAGFHSLLVLATYVDGQTPFPELSVVVMLDDVQIIYYDSDTWRVFHRSPSDSKYYDEDQSDADAVFHDTYDEMKYRVLHLKNQLNHTDGITVLQRIVGCELFNDKPGIYHLWDAHDGKTIEKFTFNIYNHEFQLKNQWFRTWDQVMIQQKRIVHENIYYPVCIKVLRRYLNVEKNSVMRKVKPRVRLMKKKLPDSQGLQISCLATGFYPRHINLTLFRDAEPVDDDQIIGGEILPNGDGMYQMRKSLIVSKEELDEGHEYTCTMKHLNLDNKLDIVFDVSGTVPGCFSVSVVISVLVFMCVSVFIITKLIMRRKRQDTGRGSEKCDYSPTISSSQDEI